MTVRDQAHDVAELQERVEFLEKKLVELSGFHYALQDVVQQQLDQLREMVLHPLVRVQVAESGQELNVRA
jgi:predicted nucleotidyltransferase